MIIVQIEHEVSNFEGWKKAFDSDPIDRKKSGVRRYSIFQLQGNPNHVIIDLEFDNLQDAENTCVMLRKMWNRIDKTLLINPSLRILHRFSQQEIK
jgi:hypothetical protein